MKSYICRVYAVIHETQYMRLIGQTYLGKELIVSHGRYMQYRGATGGGLTPVSVTQTDAIGQVVQIPWVPTAAVWNITGVPCQKT